MDLSDVAKLGVSGTLIGLCAVNRFIVRPSGVTGDTYNYWSLQAEHYLSHLTLALLTDVFSRYGGLPAQQVMQYAPVGPMFYGAIWDLGIPLIRHNRPQLDQFAADTLGAATYWLVV